MESHSKTRSKEPAASKSPSTTRQRMDSEDGDFSQPAILYHDVTAAAYRIRKGVKETPLEVSVRVAADLIS